MVFFYVRIEINFSDINWIKPSQTYRSLYCTILYSGILFCCKQKWNMKASFSMKIEYVITFSDSSFQVNIIYSPLYQNTFPCTGQPHEHATCAATLRSLAWLMLSCCHCEIVSKFWTKEKPIFFYFHWTPNYEANLVPGSDNILYDSINWSTE